jgi:hypothetical protein
MSKFFAQFANDGFVFSVVESEKKPEGADIVECSGFDDLGKKWDGKNFIILPPVKRFKIWSKPEFVLALGRSVFDAITDGTDKDLRFAKYVLDSASAVDMNDPRYVALVDMLRAKNLIDAAKLAALKVQE